MLTEIHMCSIAWCYF